MLAGTFTTGVLSVSTPYAGLRIGGGASLQVSGGAALGFDATIAVAGSGAALTVGGGVSVGAAGFYNYDTALSVSGGGAAQLGGLSIGSFAEVTVDAASTLSVGATGKVAAGSFAVAAGQVVVAGSGAGVAYVFAPAVALNGILTGNLQIQTNALTGSGQIQVSSGDTVTLQNDGLAMAAGAGPTIAFTGSGGTLSLSILSLTAQATLGPAIEGLGAGNSILWESGNLSGVSYAPATGKLTLLQAGQTVAVLQLDGSYAGETFGVAADGSGESLITVTPNAGSGGPSLGLPSAISAISGSLTPMSVSIADTAGSTMSVVLSDTMGALSANTSAAGGGGTITGSGSDLMILTGSLTQVNADLTTLGFLASTSGTDAIVISVNDGTGRVSDGAIAINVIAAMAAPHLFAADRTPALAEPLHFAPPIPAAFDPAPRAEPMPFVGAQHWS